MKAEQQYFDEVAAELSHSSLKSGIWARALAESGGDEAKARGLYISIRARELKEESNAKSNPANWSDAKKARVDATRMQMVAAWWKLCMVAFAIVAVLFIFFFATQNP